MGFLLPMLGGLLLRATPMLVTAVLKAFGVSVLVFTGMQIAMDQAFELIRDNLMSGPSQLVSILALLKVDVAVNIIFAAISGRMAMSSWTSGLTKLVLGAGSGSQS